MDHFLSFIEINRYFYLKYRSIFFYYYYKPDEDYMNPFPLFVAKPAIQ